MPQLNPSVTAFPLNPLFRVSGTVHGREDVIHLEFGEPNFATPAHIVEAAERSLRDERQRYLPSSGIASLREAIAARVSRVNGFAPGAAQIVVSPGGTGGIMAALHATTTLGDEVLVPDPAWPGYDMMLAATGAAMVRYPLLPEAGWQPDLDALEAAISPRTRVLIINTPSNPGGAVFPPETVRRLLTIAERHDLWLLSDECYDEIIFEGHHLSPATLDPERVITVGTCSKSYAMTGWRIGWVVAPPQLAAAVSLMIGAQMNNLPLFVQRAAEAALTGPQECVREMAAAYRDRRDHAVEALRSRGLLAYVPAGAFYLLVPVAPHAAGSFDGVAFALALATERHIAVAPGPSFGPATANHARVSLASSDDDLHAGIEGLLDFATAWSERGLAPR
jgi:aspartate aminotransferase/aminotransferase